MLVDKGMSSAANHTYLAAADIQSGIMFRAAWSRFMGWRAMETELDPEGDGADPAQGGQPDQACRGLRNGVCPKPARCGASGAETTPLGTKIVAATDQPPSQAQQPASEGEMQRKMPAFATVLIEAVMGFKSLSPP